MDKIGKLSILMFSLLSFLPLPVEAKVPPPNFKVTNEMIYQQLMELKEEHAGFKEKFNSIEKRFEEIDKRFEQIDKRFEQIDKRFEQVDKKFEELRKDMNRRFEESQENINRQFKILNDRFDDMHHYLNIITAIFTTLTVFVIGFAYWDRRTIIGKAKEETIREIENSGKLRDLILVLKEKAKTDRELERILKEHKLL